MSSGTIHELAETDERNSRCCFRLISTSIATPISKKQKAEIILGSGHRSGQKADRKRTESGRSGHCPRKRTKRTKADMSAQVASLVMSSEEIAFKSFVANRDHRESGRYCTSARRVVRETRSSRWRVGEGFPPRAAPFGMLFGAAFFGSGTVFSCRLSGQMRVRRGGIL